MFNSPWRIALAAAGVGMVANVLRIALVEGTVPPQAAAAIAALVVGLLAAVIAPRLDVPRITVYVPAVTIMVPGVLAYRAVFHISNGETVGGAVVRGAGRAGRRRAGDRAGDRPHAHRPHLGVRALSRRTRASHSPRLTSAEPPRASAKQAVAGRG